MEGAAQGATERDAALIERYLEHVRVEKRLAARTVELYALDLKRLADFAAGAQVDLKSVRSAHLRGWIVRMHGAGRGARGIALILSGWRGFYRWLGREGLVPGNPAQDVRAPNAARPLPKALGVDEAVQLARFSASGGVASAIAGATPTGAADPWLDCRDAAMVELLYGCGLRVAELTGLDVTASASASGWVDLDAAEVHVLGKGGKRRAVPVGRPAMAALARWLALRCARIPAGFSQDALFIGRNATRLTSQSVWQRLRGRGVQAGLAQPVHPHMLRHSFASHILQSSGDLRAVQELLGHANITSTQAYTRLDFQHLAQTYDAAHPRAKRESLLEK